MKTRRAYAGGGGLVLAGSAGPSERQWDLRNPAATQTRVRVEGGDQLTLAALFQVCRSSSSFPPLPPAASAATPHAAVGLDCQRVTGAPLHRHVRGHAERHAEAHGELEGSAAGPPRHGPLLHGECPYRPRTRSHV